VTREVHYVRGAWPTEMRAETAAAYCDEPSVEAFLSKVKRRIYPNACRQIGILPKWHRAKLDDAIARRHGLLSDGHLLAEDAVELI
jgi:hypothetical protein